MSHVLARTTPTEFIQLNIAYFQAFLNLVSEWYKDSIMIMQLGQAGAHRARRLKIPDNVILIFQPLHSPQTNPLEQVWQHLKSRLRWKLLRRLDELGLLMKARLEEITQVVIASIVRWNFILDALSVAGK